MSKTSTKDKRKYNKGTYRRYEISVRLGTKLNQILENYSEKIDDSVGNLIKTLLCKYFDIGIDDLFVDYYKTTKDEENFWTPNTCIDEMFERLKKERETGKEL